MDVLFEQQWRALVDALESRFGDGMDLQDILYLVGVQELGQGFRTFKKQEKMDLLTVLTKGDTTLMWRAQQQIGGQ